MKQGMLVLVAVLALASVMIGVRLWMTPDQETVSPEPPVAVSVEQTEQAPDMFGSVPASDDVITEAGEDLHVRPEPEPIPEPEAWMPDPQAVESMRKARLEGDPRTPPIARPERQREMPTEEELADPELYLQYEARQQQKVYASFIQASEKKISDLEAIIEQGKQGGVSDEQLAEGMEKLQRLKDMREQLLAENPELAAEQGSDAESQADLDEAAGTATP